MPPPSDVCYVMKCKPLRETQVEKREIMNVSFSENFAYELNEGTQIMMFATTCKVKIRR